MLLNDLTHAHPHALGGMVRKLVGLSRLNLGECGDAARRHQRISVKRTLMGNPGRPPSEFDLRVEQTHELFAATDGRVPDAAARAAGWHRTDAARQGAGGAATGATRRAPKSTARRAAGRAVRLLAQGAEQPGAAAGVTRGHASDERRQRGGRPWIDAGRVRGQ